MSILGYDTVNAPGSGSSIMDNILGTFENVYGMYLTDQALASGYATGGPTYRPPPEQTYSTGGTATAPASIWMKVGVTIGAIGLLIALFKAVK